MDASQLIHHIPDYVQIYAAAAMMDYPGKLAGEISKQGAQATIAGIKTVFNKIQTWAHSYFGEKASVTKSLNAVRENPEDKQAQERLIQDLQEDSTPEQLQELHSLIEELKPFINANIQINGNDNLVVTASIEAPFVTKPTLNDQSSIKLVGHDYSETHHHHYASDVKKNL
jgi:hypothetical protein